MTTTDKGTSFSFTVSRVARQVVVTGHGTLDRAGCAVLDCVLRDLIDDQGNLCVVVELGDVTVSRLECAGVLAEAATSAARRGGELVVVDAPDGLAWALEAARSGGHIVFTGEIVRTP